MALSVRGAGHGRAGASREWREHGVSSNPDVSDGSKALLEWVVNPTLFDLTSSSAPVPNALVERGGGGGGGAGRKAESLPFAFLEDQGPAGAFSSLSGLRPGTRECMRSLD